MATRIFHEHCEDCSSKNPRWRPSGAYGFGPLQAMMEAKGFLRIYYFPNCPITVERVAQVAA